MSVATAFVLTFLVPAADHGADTPPAEGLPAAWGDAWRQPPLAARPLQIVHGIPAERASVEGMRYYRDRGLGGVVCNVAFHDYLRSEANWKTLVGAVEACQSLGMIVWLYDEEGYPSGGAGGLTLARDRAFEATELAYDASRPDPFVLRPAYEHTHASNNYHAARRYINLIDDRAVRAFVELTHDAYWKRLEPYFGRTIQATFTDEPSLMAVNLGQLPESVRKNVRVTDPLDPDKPALPSVPWSYDLAEQYRRRYGEDLLAQRRGLFTGDTAADRRVRRQFWALIADLTTQRFFGTLQTWCRAHRVASSGHTLHEESILHQVPLEGNAIKALCAMDIPGLDMLTSDPAAVIHGGWLTAGLPSSAAVLTGRRRVMTEVSDFSQRMSGGGADLPAMYATAAWQAGWGVTEFTLYYGIDARPAAEHRAYGDYVGRLNAILKPAALAPRVLLYYPIWDLWAEYRPEAEPLKLASQSPRARQIVESFMRLGRNLQRSQNPFALTDHERLVSASVTSPGRLKLGSATFETIVLPAGVELPPDAAAIVQRFRDTGGRVLADEPKGPGRAPAALLEWLQPRYRLDPPSEQIAVGEFTRDGRTILLLTNVAREPYRGQLRGSTPASWLALDPATAAVQPLAGPEVILAGHSSTLLVSP